ncbi:unnamed protein product [Clonostachys rhizophaga]|uniref:Protein kinase domain-containing protein n=1 Tax=Clonostachys rhizophaga TaxID=160324 RepID=A0A9N9W4L4_9HYPO|nr:unnamed protein product [Clonostachys rhizophaga]
MEESGGEPGFTESSPQSPNCPPSANVRFRFGSRSIEATGSASDYDHPHVLRLKIHRTPLERVIQSLFWIGSRAGGAWLQNRFPEWFLPERIVLKSQKNHWEDEFDQEVAAYHKLHRLQGIIIPRLYGSIEYSHTRALILSDVGGFTLATPQGAVLDKRDLKPLLNHALKSLTELGVSHDDTKLDNFLLVSDEGKDKIMIVDLESAIFELSEEYLAWTAKTKTNWLMRQYQNRLDWMEYDGVRLPKRPLRT